MNFFVYRYSSLPSFIFSRFSNYINEKNNNINKSMKLYFFSFFYYQSPPSILFSFFSPIFFISNN